MKNLNPESLNSPLPQTCVSSREGMGAKTHTHTHTDGKHTLNPELPLMQTPDLQNQIYLDGRACGIIRKRTLIFTFSQTPSSSLLNIIYRPHTHTRYLHLSRKPRVAESGLCFLQPGGFVEVRMQTERAPASVQRGKRELLNYCTWRINTSQQIS